MQTVLNSLSTKIRAYFLRWKQRDQTEKLKEEMNEEGPVREQIFEENITLKNLVNLMKEEGYGN